MISKTYSALCGVSLTALLSVTLSSCDDYNDQFEGLDDLVEASQLDVKSGSLELTADDYVALGKLKVEGADLSKLGATQAFPSDELAQKALATYLAQKFTTADAGSSLNVTYTVLTEPSGVAAEVASATPLALPDEAYALAWPEDKAQTCLTPATLAKLPDAVAQAKTDAQEGDLILVEYKYSGQEPPADDDEPEQKATFAPLTIPTLPTTDAWTYLPSGNIDLTPYKGKTIRLAFRYVSTEATAGTVEAKNIKVGEIVSDANNGAYYANDLLTGSGDEGKNLPEGWTARDVKVEGVDYVWSFAGVKYGVKATASKKVDGVQTNFATESWLIGPAIDLSAATAPTLSVEIAANFFSGAPLTDFFGIYVSSDYVEGAPIDVPGTKAASAATLTTEKRLALYQLTAGKWKERKDARVVQPAEFTEMGIGRPNFSSTLTPADYLPAYLSQKMPYAQDEATVVVVYQFYDTATKTTTVRADDYAHTAGQWQRAALHSSTAHFVRNSEGWAFDPSVTIALPADKSAASVDFYQAIVDHVWDTVDVAQLGCSAKGQGYVTSYGNNEYYTGASAYQTNFDWRAAKATDQYAAGFTGLDEAAIVESLKKHTLEALPAVLAKLYPDAAPVEGLKVVYTINFVVYDGKSSNWTMQYEVTAPGQFAYIEDSLRAVE